MPFHGAYAVCFIFEITGHRVNQFWSRYVSYRRMAVQGVINQRNSCSASLELGRQFCQFSLKVVRRQCNKWYYLNRHECCNSFARAMEQKLRNTNESHSLLFYRKRRIKAISRICALISFVYQSSWNNGRRVDPGMEVGGNIT